MSIKRDGFLFFLGVLIIIFFVSPANMLAVQGKEKEGEATPQTKNDGTIIVVNQKIKQLLEDFSRQNGLTLNISDKLNIVVKNHRLPAEKKQFLDELSKRYSLDWYQRGNELFVSAKKERVSRIIATKNIELSALQNDLGQLAQNIEDFPFEQAENSRLVLVSGPPSYLALVELVLEAIEKSPNTNTDVVNLIGYGSKSTIELTRF